MIKLHSWKIKVKNRKSQTAALATQFYLKSNTGPSGERPIQPLSARKNNGNSRASAIDSVMRSTVNGVAIILRFGHRYLRCRRPGNTGRVCHLKVDSVHTAITAAFTLGP